jgi:hypothetical protein
MTMQVLYADYVSGASDAVRDIAQRNGHHVSRVNVQVQGRTAGILVNPYDASIFDLTLPGHDLASRLPRHVADKLTGFWLHETLHILYTDFAAWRQACRSDVSHITNGLEDCRIEGKGIANTAAKNIKATVERVLAGFIADGVANGKPYRPNDLRQLPFTLAAYGRVLHLGYNVAGLPPFSDLDPALAAIVRDYTLRAIACPDTAAVVALALDLQKKLNPPASDDDDTGNGNDTGDDTGNGDGNGDDTGDDTGNGNDTGDDTGNGDGDGDDTGDDTGNGDGDDTGNGDGDGDDTGNGDGNDTGTAAPGGGLTGGDISDAQTDNPNDAMQDQTAKPASSYDPDVAGAHCLANYGGYTVEPIAMASPAMRIVAPRLANDLRRAVRAPGRQDTVKRQTRGKFDSRAITRGYLGGENVFLKRDISDDEVAAVEILIDVSASMTPTRRRYSPENWDTCRIGKATTMAVAIGDALAQAGAQFEIHGYGDKHGRDDEQIDAATTGGNVGVTLHTAKTMSAPWSPDTARRVLALRDRCHNGTHIAPAILAGAHRLLTFAPHATRRIIFLLTDGEDGHHSSAAPLAARLAAAKGVTTVALGIGIDVTHLVLHPDYALRVNRATDLAKHGLGHLARALEHETTRTR